MYAVRINVLNTVNAIQRKHFLIFKTTILCLCVTMLVASDAHRFSKNNKFSKCHQRNCQRLLIPFRVYFETLPPPPMPLPALVRKWNFRYWRRFVLFFFFFFYCVNAVNAIKCLHWSLCFTHSSVVRSENSASKREGKRVFNLKCSAVTVVKVFLACSMSCKKNTHTHKHISVSSRLHDFKFKSCIRVRRQTNDKQKNKKTRRNEICEKSCNKLTRT